MRMPKNVKEVPLLEPPNLSAYRARFEAGRSFDLEDDLEFCPNLLTNDEVSLGPSSELAGAGWDTTDIDQRQSIYSGSSDRSSLSSGSPDASPTQHQIQPHHVGPAVNVTSAATSAFVSPPTFISAMANNNNSTHNINNTLKIHQPSPYRVRNPLPIVDPNNRSRVASPPSSVSPGVMQSSSSTGHRYQ